MQCHVFNRGLIGFQEGVRIQNKCFDSVRNGDYEAALILCQHHTVITVGRSAQADNIVRAREYLDARGIAVINADRGGDVTFHGPGQLVAYPIFPLFKMGKDIHAYLRNLEEVGIRFLEMVGVEASRLPGRTGVWIENKKISSIGVSVKKWISLHGVSINIENSCLAGYHYIRPCGMDITMTSVADCKGTDLTVEECLEYVLKAFCSVFKISLCQEEVSYG